VHWHGLRLDNRYDGTTATQRPIPVAGTFTYRLTFPDPGVYWYHPHIREDYGQEMGLYGNIVVVPAEPGYWPPAHRELTLTLDDIRLEDGKVAPFSRMHSNYTAMGRFGDVLLVNGEPSPAFQARQGEVVRFYLTNTANTRVFNVALPGARMKLVGGDSGRYERETFVDEVLIAPSERMVVDVLFDRPGELALEHRTPKRTYALAAITVGEESATPSLRSQFETLRTNSELVAERGRSEAYLAAKPDKTLSLVAEMDMGEPAAGPGGAIAYICPMDPDVVSTEPGRCPKCGMKLVPASLAGQVETSSADRGHHHSEPNQERLAEATEPVGRPAGIEWEDDMVELNRRTNPTNTRWMLIDRDTGSEGAAIDWRFRVGQQVKIRLVNETDSDHPMPHPFHIHGAGRFLIVSRNGVVEPNLVWKDTVLVGTGETVDILLDVTHPGAWMAHCHIAEHHESGMMLGFRVDP
jgi:FtsP/CotA-like multicopper oxidase with cupredoxin domain